VANENLNGINHQAALQKKVLKSHLETWLRNIFLAQRRKDAKKSAREGKTQIPLRLPLRLCAFAGKVVKFC